MPDEPADDGNLLGAFIRAQRQMANLSLRELAAMTEISNPYLSQVERGLSEPSARVLKSIAEALNLSAEALFAQAGLMPESSPRADDATETAIRTDPRLSEPQKRALLAVYRSYIAEGREATGAEGSDVVR
jgi:transcriptional regulator with XRE-family HTH domain